MSLCVCVFSARVFPRVRTVDLCACLGFGCCVKRNVFLTHTRLPRLAWEAEPVISREYSERVHLGTIHTHTHTGNLDPVFEISILSPCTPECRDV